MPSGIILIALSALVAQSAAQGERMEKGDGAAAKNTTAPSAPGAAAGQRIRCVFADDGQSAFAHGLETLHQAGGRRRKRLVSRPPPFSCPRRASSTTPGARPLSQTTPVSRTT